MTSRYSFENQSMSDEDIDIQSTSDRWFYEMNQYFV